MVSPEGFQNDGEKAVDQLGGPQDGEEDPPVREEQIQLLVPDIGRQDTSQVDYIPTTSAMKILHTVGPRREGLNNNRQKL